MCNFAILFTLFFYFLPDASASDADYNVPESSALSKNKTHYGIGYEQRMKILNNKRSSIKLQNRPVIRIQKPEHPVRPTRPYRPQRPIRPGH
ncbi:MAG: hypothetical protein KZQ83_03985 [gamma proteobacterium symbiont of Taylorina sp.]|nr:hypothetical protein [gamma proteobacterium symbiont of Taylorina sp.]